MAVIKELQQAFKDLSVVVVTHNFGAPPTKVVVYDENSSPLKSSEISSIVNTDDDTTVTLAAKTSGSVQVLIDDSSLSSGPVLVSPNGTKFMLAVADNGTLSAKQLS